MFIGTAAYGQTNAEKSWLAEHLNGSTTALIELSSISSAERQLKGICTVLGPNQWPMDETNCLFNE